MELARGFEGDAVDEAEGTLAGDGGLRVIADDVDGDLTEPFAVEQVGQRNRFDCVVVEAVLLDSHGEVVELGWGCAELSVRCVEEDENDNLVARLLSDELDLTFVIGVSDDDAIETTTLLVDPYVLVSPACVDGRITDPARLDGVPMIGQTPNGCQFAIDNALRELGVVPDYVFRTNDNAAVQAMVRAGMGYAILPNLAVDRFDPGVQISVMEPALPPRVIAIARRRGRTLPPAADRFIELARALCRDLQLPEYRPTSVGA